MKKVTVFVTEPPREEIDGIVMVPVDLTFAADYVIEALEATGKYDSEYGIIYLNKVPLPERLALLEKLVHWELCAISMLDDDDFLRAVPEAREKHNKFFGEANHIVNYTKYQEDNGEMTPEKKEIRLSSILTRGKYHKMEMEELYNANSAKMAR